MTIAQDDLFQRVPIGEKNAVPARLIWQEIGMWSPISIKGHLRKLVREGRIQRKRLARGKHETTLYFRPPE